MANLQFLTATLAAFPGQTPSYTRGKILVTAGMITNETTYTNVNSPFNLFDQPEAYNEDGSITIPTSDSWLPSYNASGYPASIYVDFGAMYKLDKIYFLDGNGNGSINFSSGAPGNWTVVATDTLPNYETWTTKTLPNVITRYLRFTYNSIADIKGVREIVLYGTRQA